MKNFLEITGILKVPKKYAIQPEIVFNILYHTFGLLWHFFFSVYLVTIIKFVV